jgi:hypothetical protein
MIPFPMAREEQHSTLIPIHNDSNLYTILLSLRSYSTQLFVPQTESIDRWNYQYRHGYPIARNWISSALSAGVKMCPNEIKCHVVR